MKQRQRRSRIGTIGLDRAIAFCFQYLKGDRLVYWVDENAKIIRVVSVGSHSE